MADLNLTELRKVAEAAVDAGCDKPGTYWGPLAAALEPTAVTVLALLDRVADLEAKAARVEALADRYDAWDGSRDYPWQSSHQDRERLRAALTGKPEGDPR